jgi:hypothetical protein
VEWKIGKPQATAIGLHYGVGVTLGREGRSPALRFVFRDEKEAKEAARLLEKVLDKALAIG